jgi:AcrR family transcriptional regulator
MPEPSIDFKEQMVEARRTQILMGAAQVFVEKGFHKSTTKEIAKAAGVSEGTIYNYFDTKRELLIALMESVITESLKRIIFDTPPENPRELFLAIMRDRYQLADERGHVLAPVVAEVFSDVELRELLYQRVLTPIASHLEQYVQTHIDSGQFRQIDPLVVTRAMMGALVMTFAIKLTNLDPRYEDISEEVLFEQLASLFLDGLLVSEQSSVISEQSLVNSKQ